MKRGGGGSRPKSLENSIFTSHGFTIHSTIVVQEGQRFGKRSSPPRQIKLSLGNFFLNPRINKNLGPKSSTLCKDISSRLCTPFPTLQSLNNGD